MSKANSEEGVKAINTVTGKQQPEVHQDKDINKFDKSSNKKDVKEDFKDEDVPVEPVMDDDGNEIGGEG